MIWHVIKKDFKTLWWLRPMLLAAAAGYGFSYFYRMGAPVGSSLIDLAQMALVVAWPYLAASFALARAVQTDSPVTPLGDWHTRPISRWTLLGAKAATGFFGVAVLWGLIDLGWGLYWGLPAGAALLGALYHGLVLACLMLVVIACAASMRGFTAFLLTLGGLLLGAFILEVGLPPLMHHLSPGWSGTVGFLPAWIDNGLTTLMLLGFVAALALLYHRRRKGLARTAILISGLGLPLFSLVTAEVYGRAWSPEVQPGNVTVSLDPLVWRSLNPQSGILSTSLSADAPGHPMLTIRRAVISRQWADGSVDRHVVTNGAVGAGLVLATTLFKAPDARPVQVQVAYSLGERTPLPPVTLATRGASLLPGGAVCRLISSKSSLNPPLARCIANQPFCVQTPIAPLHYDIGCSSTRPLTAFYEIKLYPPSSGDISLIPLKSGPLHQGRVNVGWLTPRVISLRPPTPGFPAAPSPPVNAN